MDEQSAYRVRLDVYSGPLDLLLFLIQRDEVDIYDIPIARITEQYLEYVELLQLVDPEVVSEFLVLAATLMEIKSRTLLPKPPPEEIEAEIVDPRLELVKQLLAYKQFKDAARSLEESAAERALKHARAPAAPESPSDELELENLDIWDLFEAFNKLLKQIGKAGVHYRIDVDDTPVSLHAEDIMDSLERSGGQQPFEDIFTGRSRGEMIGLFLAILELVRLHRIRVKQDRPFGTIVLYLIEHRPIEDEELEQRASSSDAPLAGPAEPAWDEDRAGPSSHVERGDEPGNDLAEIGPTLVRARTAPRVNVPAAANVQSSPPVYAPARSPDDATRPDALDSDPVEEPHDPQPSTR
jgi:segregation and condensation protein A